MPQEKNTLRHLILCNLLLKYYIVLVLVKTFSAKYTIRLFNYMTL